MDRLSNNSQDPPGDLRFSGNALLEKKFQYDYLSDSVELIRVGLLLLLVLCLLVGLRDITESVDISQYILLLGIILAIVVGILLSISFTEFFIRHHTLLINFVLLLVCVEIAYCFFERYKQYSDDEASLMVVMIVLIFWVYEFSRLGLMRSSQWGCLISMVYIAFATAFFQANQVNSLLDMIMLIIANIIGMTVSYDNEKYARLLFYEKLSINKLF